MKKRLFMVFTLSVFIVSIMAAAAMAGKPTFKNGSAINTAVGALKYNNTSAYSLTLTATASPDLTKVTVSDTKPIAGITLTVASAMTTGTGGTTGKNSEWNVTIAGTPTEAVKGKKVTVTATNKDGDTKLNLTFNSTYDKLEISYPSGNIPGWTGSTKTQSGLVISKDMKLSAATVRALPGPVTWKVKDLPKGITYKTTSTDITLSGTYTGLTAFSKAIGATSADAKKYNYTITATNKAVTTSSASTSGDVFVITSPEITTKSLPVLTLGKEYNAKIAVKNYPKDVNVYFGLTKDISIGTAGKNATSTVTNIAVSSDVAATTVAPTYGLTFSSSDMKITGSFDKIPTTGTIYAMIAATAYDGSATITKTLPIEFKAIAPKFDKPENLDFDNGNIVFKITTGTRPLVVSIDVEDKVRQSYGSSKDQNIIAKDAATNPKTAAFNELGFSVTTNYSDGTGTDPYLWMATLTPTAPTANTLAQAYKGLKLTLTASNPATGSKVVKKQFGITRSDDIEIVWKQGTASATPSATDGTDVTNTTINMKNIQGGEELEANSTTKKAIPAGQAIATSLSTGNYDRMLQFYTNVPKPYTIALSGDKAINGISVDFTANTQATAGMPGYAGGILKIGGIPTKSKDTVTKLKLVATNKLTKQKAQATVIISAYDQPYFTNSNDLGTGKDIVAGKKVSIKGKMKAHKDLLPTITYTTPTGTTLSDSGLTFETDETKGTFEIAGAAGETKPTLNSGKTAYESKDVEVKWKNAYNGTTDRTNKVKLRIIPLQPKIKTSKVTYTMNTEATNTEQKIELSNMEVGDTGTNLKFGPTSLFDGAALGETNGVITFTKANLTPTKSKAVNISVDNYGIKSATKSVKFTINAPKPTVTASPTTVTIAGSNDDKVEAEVTFTAADDCVKGDTKLKWKITTKPDGLGAKIKAAKDTKTATVTITAKKGSQASGSLTLGVTATNTVSKESSEERTVTITATAAPSTDSSTKDGATRSKDTATDEATEPMKEEDVEVGEGKVIRGKARTEAALTATQRTLIAEAGYIVVAVLPEVEVTAAGQYPFPVEIPEEIAAGKELAWFAFSTKPSEDDEIVDFFDEEGKDTKVVPESHKITVYPWLNTDVTYAPVIAVKADNGEEGAETEEQIQEKTVRAVKK